MVRSFAAAGKSAVSDGKMNKFMELIVCALNTFLIMLNTLLIVYALFCGYMMSVDGA